MRETLPQSPPCKGQGVAKRRVRFLLRFTHYWGLWNFFLLLLALPLHARPQTLVVLADGLTLTDITRPDLPGLASLQHGGALALMSPGLAGKPDPVANVYTTLGAGDSVRVGDVSQGRMAESLRRVGVRTALIGQDIGPSSPARLILPNPAIAAETTNPARAWALTQSAFRTCDLVIVRFTDAGGGRDVLLHRLDVFFGQVLKTPQCNLFLVVPTPPLLLDGTWNQMTPFLAFCPITVSGGCNTEYYPVAQSSTTQTWGLVAARDFAPTLLASLLIAPPVQMTGADIEPSGVRSTEEVLPHLRRMDRMVRLNQEAQNAIFWTVGIGAGAIVFSGIALYLSGRMRGNAGKLARYGLRVLASWTLALLLAPLADPYSVNSYLFTIAGLTALLAFIPSPPLLFTLTAFVVIVDGLTGTRLVSNSALSEYALSGIRFYGIGNEYMGVLIGGALLATGSQIPIPVRRSLTTLPSEGRDSHSYGRVRFLPAPQNWGGGALLWFALVTFALSFPAFGAKAGGAVTATATFYIAWRRLTGRNVNWKHLLGSVVAGFALVFVWAILSHWLHLRRTHLETAAGALGQGRFGYILGVALRKIGLAVRVAMHPGTILGLLAFALIGILGRWLFRQQVTEYLAAHPRFAAIWWSGLWGCTVAVLFNDSGIVAAILILQCLVLTLLHGLYSEERYAPAGS